MIEIPSLYFVDLVIKLMFANNELVKVNINLEPIAYVEVIDKT